jgi:hypothetical protein
MLEKVKNYFFTSTKKRENINIRKSQELFFSYVLSWNVLCTVGLKTQLIDKWLYICTMSKEIKLSSDASNMSHDYTHIY